MQEVLHHLPPVDTWYLSFQGYCSGARLGEIASVRSRSAEMMAFLILFTIFRGRHIFT